MILMMSIFVGSMFLGLFTYRYKKLYVISTFFLLAFLSSIRGSNVGIDTSNYLGFFSLINEQELLVSFNNIRLEKGYILLNYLLGLFTNNSQIILIITSFFINFSFGRTIYKYSDNVVVSTMIYILFFYPSSMNGVRQYFAFSIFLLGLELLFTKKRLKFVLVILLATLFHSSAIILLVFLFSSSEFLTKNRRNFAWVTLIALLLINNFDFILSFFVTIFPAYNRFLESEIYSSTSSISVQWLIIYILIFVSNTFQITKVVMNDSRKELKLFYSLWQMFFIVIYIFSSQLWIANRLLIYFKPVLCFIIPSILEDSKLYKKNLFGIYLSLALSIVLIFWFYNMVELDPHNILPYSTFFHNI